VKESKEKRSQIMRAVKGKDTAPELKVRKLIHSLGYRYRLHASHLPGKPDIYFSQKKKAISIHGCFWHGHSCKRGDRIPSTNTEYWKDKIGKNKLRDKKAFKLLSEKGWSTLIIWECYLKEIEWVKHKVINFLEN
jgi:DNA mismatch endonuclease, patch repair protein